MVIHNVLMHVYGAAIKVASIFNPKAKEWVKGRKKQARKLLKFNESTVLFHCASLGEYEQAKPLISAYKSLFPSTFIWVSFFSPSGYLHHDENLEVDNFLYLPLDTKGNMQLFFANYPFKEIFLVKYEVWPNLIEEAHKLNIPVSLVCANFRPDQIYFKWYGGTYRKALSRLETVLLQYKPSIDISFLPISSSSVIGDARFDNVWNLTTEDFHNEVISAFLNNNKPTILLGSCWEKELEIAKDIMLSEQGRNWNWIIAPHDISPNFIKKVHSIVPSKKNLFSEGITESNSHILLIDKIGILKYAYRYAQLSFIGGGYTGKLHNILEAGAYGSAVCFGPKHSKFPEAQAMINFGGAHEIHNTNELEQLLRQDLNNMGENAKRFIREHRGCGQNFAKHIQAKTKKAKA